MVLSKECLHCVSLCYNLIGYMFLPPLKGARVSPPGRHWRPSASIGEPFLCAGGCCVRWGSRS